MNRDDIIRMAREAGFICLLLEEAIVPELAGIYSDDANAITQFERFAALVAAAKQEECANLVQDLCDRRVPASEYAAAIRARGDKV